VRAPSTPAVAAVSGLLLDVLGAAAYDARERVIDAGRGTAMRRVGAMAMGLLALGLAVALAAGAPLLFETISLTSITAADLAPRLGPIYRVAGAPAPSAAQPAEPSIVPAEMRLVTAGNPNSQLLLVYGPEKAMRVLAHALGELDVPPPKPAPARVRLSITLNGALPREMGDWTTGPEMSGLTTQVKDFGASAGLRYRSGRHGYEMGSAFAVLRAGAPELVALPRIGPLPQLVLSVEARPNPDGTIALSLGAAPAEEKRDPWQVVDEASKKPLVVTVKPRQQLAVALMRGDSGVTLMFSTSVVEAEVPPAPAATAQ
jgi:hypothetical protein